MITLWTLTALAASYNLTTSKGWFQVVMDHE